MAKLSSENWRPVPNLLAAPCDKSQGELGDRVPRITPAGEAVIVCIGNRRTGEGADQRRWREDFDRFIAAIPDIEPSETDRIRE